MDLNPSRGVSGIMKAQDANKLGDVVHKVSGLVELGTDPSKLLPETMLLDCHFIQVGVNKVLLEEQRDTLLKLFESWPREREVSYLEAGVWFGSQSVAFQVFAVGEALGLWTVGTPKRILGESVSPEILDMMAGRGLITTLPKPLVLGCEDARVSDPSGLDSGGGRGGFNAAPRGLRGTPG